MDNLKSPAHPVIMNGPSFENGYDGFKPGFTKLELASLMIAQGFVSYGYADNIDDASLARRANEIAKAVLEEANK